MTRAICPRPLPASAALSLCLLLCSCTAPQAARGAAPSTQPSIQWVSWSDDLFLRASREHKLVLLDLQAVWCHWCHVMDQNTYSDPKVIELIGSKYIAVKVDQDSRPDISNRYEDWGWPATVVFDEHGKELVKRQGYIPPKPMAAMLQAVIDDPTPGPSVKAEAPIEFGSNASLSDPLRHELESRLDGAYDAVNGGWGTIHKFADWDAIERCMIQARRGNAAAEQRARQTLNAGLKLIDPVWGGVYQYSTNGDWDHPHFEKLISFQAEMMRLYAQAWAMWRDPAYLQAANDIHRYVRTFLTSPDGAFYVSQDADLVEGQHSADYFALDDVDRRRRGIPRVDTHLYASTNGIMISALAQFHALTGDEQALLEARRAAEWVLSQRQKAGGGFRHDQADVAGPYLADTLQMGRAFLALCAVTGQRQWLNRAVAAAGFIGSHFAPSAEGDGAGLTTSAGPAAGAFKPLPEVDENIAAARFLNLLGHYTGNPQERSLSERAMRYLASPQVARPRGFFVAGLLLADEELRTDPLHVTVVGPKSDASAGALFQVAAAAPVSYKRVEWFDPAEGPLPNADVEYPQLPAPAAFLCTGNACSTPLTSRDALAARLEGRR